MKVQINNTTAGHVLYLDGVEIADSDHAYNIASEVGAIDNDGNIISGFFEKNEEKSEKFFQKIEEIKKNLSEKFYIEKKSEFVGRLSQIEWVVYIDRNKFLLTIWHDKNDNIFFYDPFDNYDKKKIEELYKSFQI